MARDHRKLQVFLLADHMVVRIHDATRHMPVHERYGLQGQMRRAAVSVPTNIVEGCGRNSEADFLRFLDVAFGSCREVIYLVGLTRRLKMIDPASADEIDRLCGRVAAGLAALRRALRR